MMIKFLTACGLALVLATTTLSASEEGLSQRGVILSKRPASSTYRLRLHRDGKVVEVPNNYEFRSGDKFALHVSAKEGAGYLYVLNRTITGSPDRIRETASRGIQLASNGRPTTVTAEQEEELLAEGSASASEYRLVYPQTHKKVAPGWVMIPSGDLFEMDNSPGIEQLLIIISPKQLTDFTQALEKISRASAKPERMQAQQQLRVELAQMAANAESADPPVDQRSIVIEDLPSAKPSQVEGRANGSPQTPSPSPSGSGPGRPKPNHGVGAPVDASRPYLIQLTLVHI